MDDIVLFVYNDSGHGKESIDWKVGRIVAIKDKKVIISFLG